MSLESEKLSEEAFLEARGLPLAEQEAFVARLAETDPVAADLMRRRLHATKVDREDYQTAFVGADDAAERLLGEGEGDGEEQDEGEEDLGPTQDLGADLRRQSSVRSVRVDGRGVSSRFLSQSDFLDRQNFPDRIADYQILEVLGRGGMGIVFRALQETPIRREVALKVLQPHTVSEQTLWRFDRERQTLALMSHPGVAQVFDAGITDDGQHYFVMELVRGERITDYCGIHRLDLKSRLELLIDVCQAVGHAHQKGILHRDLKPSNVLVQTSTDSDSGSGSSTNRAQIKVIDFGIAKLLDSLEAWGQDLTGSHQILGTPAYMSPERILTPTASGDTRSDVYSLGVLLFELLTGHRPFEADNAVELLRKVEAGIARRPSRVLADSLRAEDSASADRTYSPEQLEDLDWVTLKALEREPDRRYSSVTALAEDLQNFLARRPVTARPPTRIYRLRRFVQRHRVAVVLSVIAGTALLLGFALATAGFVRARAAEEQFREQARATQAVNDFLVEVLASADPSRSGEAVRVVDLLERASETLESRLGEQPVRAAGIRQALGRTFLGLGEFDKAEREAGRALESFEAHLGSQDVQTLVARRVLAKVRLRQGQETDIVESLRGLLEELRAEVGEDHPEVFSTQVDLGHALSWRGDHAAAEELLKPAIARQIEHLGESDASVLRAQATFADILLAGGQFEAAEALARSILDAPVARPAATDFVALYVLAAASDMGGDLVGAEASFRRLYELQSRVLGEEHPSTLDSAYNLSKNLLANYRVEEGHELGMQVLEIRQRLLGPDHPRTLSSQLFVGYSALHQGDLDLAQENLAAGLEGSRRVLGESHPQTRNALDLRAQSLMVAGDLQGAEKLLREAVALDLDAPEPYFWGSRALLGRILVFLGQPEEGLEVHRGLLEDWQGLMPAGHKDILHSQALVAMSAAAAGEVEASQMAFDFSQAGFASLSDSDPSGAMTVGVQLLEASLIQERPEAGQATFDHLVQTYPELSQTTLLSSLRELDRSYPGTAAPEWIGVLVAPALDSLEPSEPRNP